MNTIFLSGICGVMILTSTPFLANAINSYVIESLEQKELAWFPYDETAMAGEENQEEDEI